MKKIPLLLVAVLFTSFAFNSCKKSSDNNVAPTGTTASMKLTANGTALSYNTCIELDASVNGSSQIAITATNVTGSKISDDSFEVDILADPTTIKAGQTFAAATTFGQANTSVLFYFPNDSDIDVTQPKKAEGTVTITEVSSTLIKGTFSGKLYDSEDFAGATLKYTITGGTFVATRSK